ncbi:hypothetical protein [Lapillicoccus jejuensis]|uniref:YVTN family beta-propeller protein n=1 Tax=Lapillicoccus jejuensis TaxID=402171 RepID=A0A542E2E9_9MICO|nr:hypothetical protein [Lapillicoccus jejuensis]TQJ09459.1 YVTN family beta-propeller protein [Lapillicoccus jejuensis]
MTRPTRATRRRTAVLACATAVALGLLGACSSGGAPTTAAPSRGTGTTRPSGVTSTATSTASATAADAAVTGRDVYAADGVGMLTGAARSAKPLVYVPDQVAGLVQVIDPSTYRVVATYHVASSPEHVVPSHDLTTLWVNSDAGDTLTPIDPRTGTPGTPVHVFDPYNLYFSPDGRYALVMSERARAIEVRDAHTMAAVRDVPVGCAGLNHADVTADRRTMLASCEFSGELVEIDPGLTHVVKTIDLDAIATPGATDPAMARSMGGPAGGLVRGASSMPQDVRLTPDGRWFLAADMLRNGVWVIDARTFTVARFIPTGKGAHGIYFSRDASRVYVSNRDEGTISVLDAATLVAVTTWVIPGGGSPDMGGVSADGKELWLSGRYSSVVYVFDTTTGRVTHEIPVASGPHGLLVWPQPGRISLGHTGTMR